MTATAIAPTGIRANTGRAGRKVSKDELRAKLNPRGNTVLRDFGRVLRDEPHKYIYPLKLYMVNNSVKAEPLLNWLRERYVDSKGGVHHGTRYEVRTYKAADGKRYVDYILLERMTDEERMLFTLQFGDITDEKIIRDGKLRRPRLKGADRKRLDKMIEDFYLEVALRQQAEVAE